MEPATVDNLNLLVSLLRERLAATEAMFKSVHQQAENAREFAAGQHEAIADLQRKLANEEQRSADLLKACQASEQTILLFTEQSKDVAKLKERLATQANSIKDYQLESDYLNKEMANLRHEAEEMHNLVDQKNAIILKLEAKK